MKPINLLSSEDAVSDVVDFVTILGIMLLAISIISVAGFPMIQKAQEGNHIENTIQSFIVMGDNLDKIVSGQAPSQSVEMKIYGDTISIITNSVKVSMINITLINETSYTYSFERPLGVIEADFDDVSIAYENTGVWAKYNSGTTIMLSKPDFIQSNDSFLIPVTTIVGSSSIGGQGLMRIVAKEMSGDLQSYKNITSIRIRVNSSYNDGWHSKFLNRPGWHNSANFKEKNFDSPGINVYILHKLINVGLAVVEQAI